MSYHNKIMGIEIVDDEPRARTLNYKIGHKDARHAAAEIANEADTVIADLLEACEAAYSALGFPIDDESMNRVTNQLAAAIAKAKGAK